MKYIAMLLSHTLCSIDNFQFQSVNEVESVIAKSS